MCFEILDARGISEAIPIAWLFDLTVFLFEFPDLKEKTQLAIREWIAGRLPHRKGCRVPPWKDQKSIFWGCAQITRFEFSQPRNQWPFARKCDRRHRLPLIVETQFLFTSWISQTSTCFMSKSPHRIRLSECVSSERGWYKLKHPSAAQSAFSFCSPSPNDPDDYSWPGDVQHWSSLSFSAWADESEQEPPRWRPCKFHFLKWW
jgi:hypothetical protein